MILDEAAFLVKGTTSTRFGVLDSLRPLTPAWLCVASALILSLLGVYAIDLAERPVNDGALAMAAPAIKQAIIVAGAFALALLVAVPHYRFSAYLAVPAMLVMLALLVFLLLPMVPSSIVAPRNGTRGWINLKFFLFQPSEITKIAYVLLIARYLRYRDHHRKFCGLVPLGIITAIPVGLITIQPDLGTAALFIPALFAMLLAAGARIRHLAIIVVAAALTAPASYPLLRPHQQQRIASLWDQIQGDMSTASTTNFQALTAQRVAGAGGLVGTSDAQARSLLHYNRLPEAHNDMVFAVVVARFGVLGGLAVAALYAIWMLGAAAAAAMTRDPFARLVVVGVSAFIATQAIINIAMTIGIFPIVGITLPFVSYGGSSIIACWLMTALVLSVGVHRPLPPYRNSFEFEQ